MSSRTITTAEKVNEKRKDTGKRKILTKKTVKKSIPSNHQEYSKKGKPGPGKNAIDSVSVVQIMTHKNSKHGIKYMLKFSDNTQELATESEAMIDCKDLLLEYKNKVLHKKRKTRKKVVMVSINSYRCEIDHQNFDSFVEESNDKYFAEGTELFNVKCIDCSIKIVEGEKIQTFRPSVKFPAYMCRNRPAGCRQIICNKCAKIRMLSANKRTRRR